MNKTPRTDRAAFNVDDGTESFSVVKAKFAEKLEQELAEARAEISGWSAIADMQRVRLKKRDEAIVERDAQIEQMREVLKSVMFALGGAYLLSDDQFMVTMEELAQPVKAALEAAGRGE